MTIKNHLYLLTLIFLFTRCASLKNATSGTFKDKRDGQTYKWVRLKDGKKWMAQNLNYEMADSWCYDNKDRNCAKYGRLYTWDAAMKACPKGWRLPTDDDWWEMTSQYGKAYNSRIGQEKNRNKDAGEETYRTLIKGGDSGFSALLGGSRFSHGVYGYLGDYGRYWSSTEWGASSAWYYSFSRSYQTCRRSGYGKSVGRSCRCVQD